VEPVCGARSPLSSGLGPILILRSVSFLNEEPKPEDHKPDVYPHPLGAGWEELIKSAAEKR
jgi:hypothetical protein